MPGPLQFRRNAYTEVLLFGPVLKREISCRKWRRVCRRIRATSNDLTYPNYRCSRQVICNRIRLGNVVACIDLHSFQLRIVQSQSICRILYHFVQFGRPLSPAQVVWTKSVPCPLSPTHVADTKMWFEKRVKNGNFRKSSLQSVFSDDSRPIRP